MTGRHKILAVISLFSVALPAGCSTLSSASAFTLQLSYYMLDVLHHDLSAYLIGKEYVIQIPTNFHQDCYTYRVFYLRPEYSENRTL
jgi:hypothetical protein